MKKFIFTAIFLVLLLLSYVVYDFSRFFDGKLHIVFCDVGQGDAVFVRTPSGDDILIDGGPDESVLSCLGNNMPFWDRNIEIMFLTHPHADHLNGELSVLERYSVTYFIEGKSPDNGELTSLKRSFLAEKNLSAKNFMMGDAIKTKDRVVFTTLGPDFSLTTASDLNSYSLEELLVYKNFSAFFPGDAPAEQEEAVFPGEVDVLKVGHHGSRTATSSKLISKLKPKAAIISSGRGNRYKHPHKETLQILKSAGVEVFRTDQTGEVEVVTDGDSWWVME